MSRPWAMVPLEEILRERQEVPSAEALANGGIRIVAKIGFNDGKIQLRNGSETKTGMILVRPGDLLVSGINAAKGAIAIYGEENTEPITATIHYGAYIPNKSRVDVNYLWWLLRSNTFRDLLLRYVPGGIKTELKAKRLLPIPVPIPSVEEQRRIVAKIQELAAKIGEARGLRQRSVVEIETLISSAGKHFFSAKDLEHLIRLEVLTTRITKGESPEWQGFTYQDSGPFFVRSENVLWGKFNKSKQVHIPVEFHEKLSRSQLCAGDVLINLVGASIGRSCVVPDDLGKANVNQAVAVISPDQKQLDSKFLMHFLVSEPAQKTIHGGKVETARPNISLTDLRNLMIPVYSLNEQLRIVAYLDGLQGKVDAVKNVQDHTAAELDALLPSILDKAFKGEL